MLLQHRTGRQAQGMNIAIGPICIDHAKSDITLVQSESSQSTHCYPGWTPRLPCLTRHNPPASCQYPWQYLGAGSHGVPWGAPRIVIPMGTYICMTHEQPMG